ncbi:hypothetical protein PC129_g17490 [Phytophthora cactorum]|uniref:Uncharacterized protein n=1 Tax=Phytophthora cactorum TaxID=29920 RepID=A0A8T1HG49_9STRA|nr:hypothetical protein PC114_g18268 [Phytophthora cactorum]KAG3211545.1 hypothetical protein PC129_g17490 [Phytophthora cactorum]KAG4047201.1 hypothetical protein PC123_g17427 [Phytophthora cactorum]
MDACCLDGSNGHAVEDMITLFDRPSHRSPGPGLRVARSDSSLNNIQTRLAAATVPSTVTATWYFATHVVRCLNGDIGSTHGSVWNTVTHTGSAFHAFLFS